MKTEPTVKIMAIVLLLGSLWGLAEATLGYLAHIAFINSPGLPGFLLFPISYYFASQAYRLTGSRLACVGAAVIGGGIKLFDLLLPLPHPIFAVNPALAMIIEALAVMTVMSWVGAVGPLRRFGLILTSVWIYRAGFVGLQFVFLATGITPANLNYAAKMMAVGVPMIVGYFVTEALVNAALIWAASNLKKMRTGLDDLYRRLAWSWAAPSLFALAASLEMLFKFAR